MDEPIEKTEQNEQPQQVTEEKIDVKKPKAKFRIGLLILHIASVIVLTAGTAAGVYFWREKVADDAAAKLNDQIASLQKTVKTLNSQVSGSTNSSGTTTTTTSSGTTTTGTTTTATTSTISDTAKTNITLAVSTLNTQPLEGYMADSVNVILAATEAYGPQTASQATADVTTFLGTSNSITWDFDLSEATLNSTYRTSGYSQYFPVGALVGKSSDNKVISFIFNSSSKISTIFMASAADMAAN